MKFRRIWRAGEMRPMLQEWIEDHWEDCGRGVLEWLQAPIFENRPEHSDSEIALPFQPLSFRDFMLYERHAVDAARGYAQRFMPRASRIAGAWERISGATFPLFKPRALWHRQPIYYFGNHLAFVPSGTPVRIPSYSSALDYELELGFTLARPLLNASPHEAESAIGAFVVLCDFSARDVQKAEMDSGFGPQKSKHFLNSLSETAVMAEGMRRRIENLKATVEIDGVVAARTSTAGMRYSIGEILAHVSRDERLYPGELFGLGALPGGCGMENGHWLKSGSRLRLTIEDVGEIEHEIL